MGEAESQPQSVEAEADPLLYRVLNERFTIVAPIGAGGMGKVYRAIQSPLDRVVAVKVLNPSYANAQDPAFRQRFFLEASLTAKLRHRNTITVLDYGQTPDGIFYIAMEYLEGQPLSQLMAKSGPLHWTRCLQIGQQICRSLREAHKLGIVHRDLKPANVMLLTEDREDIVKVLDFGLVKSFIREGNTSNSEVTSAGMFLGSPQYMAPEQARNHADPRSDIYALGVLLYQMLAGRPPFMAKDTIDVIFKHMNESPPPLRSSQPEIELPKDVEALVMKCLEKQPSWRFQSMDDVLEAIRKAASAAGMDNILAAESGANGAGPTPAPMRTPALASDAAEAKDATFAIDISVDPPRQANAFQRLGSLARNPKMRLGAIAVVSLALVLAGTAFVVGRRDSAGREPAPAQIDTPRVLQETPTAVLPAPKQPEPAGALERRAGKLVKFRIITEPEGAHVWMGRRSMGSTPLAFDVPARSDGTATAELLLTLKGYHAMTVVTGGSGPEVVLSQRLQSRSSPKPTYAIVDRREVIPRPVDSEKPEEKKSDEPPPTPKPPPEDRAASAPAPPPATSPPPPKAPIDLDESKVQLTKLSGPDPEYTPKAVEREVEGVMLVKCVVTTEGTVHNCRVLKGLPFMDSAVVNALQRRKYKPYILNGQPTEIDYTFKIKLTLPQ